MLKAGEMRRLLNVDDTEGLRYAKTRALQRAGFTVLEAATGKEALDLVAQEKPDLVLLDVKLPDVSGLEICKIIKKNHPGTMILQISATFVQPADRVRGLDIGADAYLTEPLSPEELVANVRALLRLKDAESQKEILARQKELLFKELNHRVKNNLQLISSLLNAQSRRITDPKAREEFRTAQQRVRTIASLHARLYRDDSYIGAVNVKRYLGELSEQLKTLMLAERPNVSLTARGDDFSIDIDRATSVGLIINELVSNAAKHAFRDGQAGTIFVELAQKGGLCTLCVADDGRGRHEKESQDSGLGLKLVELFAQQMDGTVSQESTPGLRVTVKFPLDRRSPEPEDRSMADAVR